MVSLRSRQTVAAAPPPLPGKGVARGFTHHKSAAAASTISQTNGKVKEENASPRKRVKGPNGTSKVELPASEASPRKRKSPTKKDSATIAPPAEETLRPLLSRTEVSLATTIDYPTLPFDLEAAKAHLRAQDVRFHSMLDTVELKPFMELIEGRVRDLDLFKTLATSILGQQVSWLAARAIIYRFIRLFYPDLPEKPDFDNLPREALPFPHPIDVCQSDDALLRSAGLSGAKVKYVKDVAQRFSDGRLDAREIVKLSEEQCIVELVKIKGVGRWTAEMLLMFALRRGNILPVGDLGVQKGMVLFYTSGPEGPVIADKKRKKGKGGDTVKKEEDGAEPSIHDADEKVTTVEGHLTESQLEVERSIAGAEAHETGSHVDAPAHGTAINAASAKLPALPEGISASMLKGRREGKKTKGNAYLTPAEMEVLAADWAPFRSIAVYMMWALVD